MQRLFISVVAVAAGLMTLGSEARAQAAGGFSRRAVPSSGGITWRTHSPTPSASSNQQYQRPLTPQQRTQPQRALAPVKPLTQVKPLQPLKTIGPLRPLQTSPLYRPQPTAGRATSSRTSSGPTATGRTSSGSNATGFRARR
jgi:hypothetical protein